MYHVDEIFGVVVGMIRNGSSFPSSRKSIVGAAVDDVLRQIIKSLPHLKDPLETLVCVKVRNLLPNCVTKVVSPSTRNKTCRFKCAGATC